MSQLHALAAIACHEIKHAKSVRLVHSVFNRHGVELGFYAPRAAMSVGVRRDDRDHSLPEQRAYLVTGLRDPYVSPRTIQVVS